MSMEVPRASARLNSESAVRVARTGGDGPKGRPHLAHSGSREQRNTLCERVSLGGPGWNRTIDRRIMSPLLSALSSGVPGTGSAVG
jgi:hypothetical protein